MTSLVMVALTAVLYSAVLLLRSDQPEVLLTFFGLGQSVFPKLGVWLVHIYTSAFFTAGGMLLMWLFASGRARSITVLGVDRAITPENRHIIIRNLWVHVLALVGGAGIAFVPDATFGLDRVGLGNYFVLGAITSILASIWTLRRL